MKQRHLYNRHLYNCHQVYIGCTSGGASILILSYKFFSINSIKRVYMKTSFMSSPFLFFKTQVRKNSGCRGWGGGFSLNTMRS